MDLSAASNNKNIKILVVDDDSTCLAVVASVLRKEKYQVVTTKHPKDALITIRIDGGFDLVVSDVHMPEMNGFQLQQLITAEFDLPVILMSADGKVDMVAKGMATGDNFFFISKPVTTDDVRDLWRIVASKRCMDELPAASTEELPAAPDSDSDGDDEASEPMACSMGSPNNNNKRSKRKCRKKKLRWSSSLHNKFMEAIRMIGGINKAVPTKILEAMGVQGLTRAHISSHLQKYRIYLKNVTDNVDCSPRPRYYQPSFGRNILTVAAARPRLGGFTTGFGYGQSNLLSRVAEPCYNNNNLGGLQSPRISSNNMLGNPIIYQPNFAAPWPSLPPFVFNGNEAPITQQTFAAANYNNDMVMMGARADEWPNDDRMMMSGGVNNNNVVVPEPFDHHHQNNDDMILGDDNVFNLLESEGYGSTANNPPSTVTPETPFSPTTFFVDTTMEAQCMDELQTPTPPPPTNINNSNGIVNTGGGENVNDDEYKNMLLSDAGFNQFLMQRDDEMYVESMLASINYAGDETTSDRN